MYAVGIDIGTTYTAAAVWRDGRAEIAALGSHSAAIPSAVFLRPDGSFLTGEIASRRGLNEPGRVVREFKRRLGDTAPILVGGTPYSAAALTAKMLRSVLDAVIAREGGPPASICVTHPASWGPYKIDLMRQVVRLADIEQPVSFTTEPQAAAGFHAHRHRLEPGAVVAVYDLGGGIFDAAVLRKTSDGFGLIGEPEGIEGRGGNDVDDAVFAHVAGSIGDALERLDRNDPAVITAVACLRAECTQAKEALSTDTDAVIQVLLPTVSAEVRLTRSELEAVVRPLLKDSIEALRRTIRSAGYAPEALGSVLLLGGSSRMPIVAQMIGSELGRPVAVDADPKHAVALGAAWQASSAVTAAGPASPAPAEPAATHVSDTAARAAAPAGTPSEPIPDSDSPTGEIPRLTEVVDPMPAAGDPGEGTDAGPATGGMIPRRPLAPEAGFVGRVAVGSSAGAEPTTALPVPPPAQPTKAADRRVVAFVAAAAVLLLAIGGTTWLLGRSRSRDDAAARAAAAVQHHAGTASSPATGDPAAAVPADEQCTDEMKKSTRWVCLTKATLHDDTFTVWYDSEWNGSRPDIKTGFHLHLYGGDGSRPDESTMGSQAVHHSKYYFEDQQPSVRKTSDPDFQAVGDAEKVCARIAQSGHGLAKAYDGSYHTGNCIPIQRY
jgi:actin-like ATPase involved in cell morphogenesis